MLGEVHALMDELKKSKKGNNFRKNMLCSQCKQEGHTKEEFVTTTTCAICVMYNHSTSYYRYNMKNILAAVNHMEAQNGQPSVTFIGRGRGR